MYCKRMERKKFLALKFNDNNFERKIQIKNSMFEDLRWWKRNILTGFLIPLEPKIIR